MVEDFFFNRSVIF